MNAKTLINMKNWLIDVAESGCFANVDCTDAEDLVNSLTDDQIIIAINKYFDGGIHSFMQSEEA